MVFKNKTVKTKLKRQKNVILGWFNYYSSTILVYVYLKLFLNGIFSILILVLFFVL